jgi:predicted nucleic acid-binding protein
MNLVDSSGWLSFFSDNCNAKNFLLPITNVNALLIPTIVIYEVFKVILRESGEQDALLAQAHLQQGTISELSTETALQASKISLEYRLPMADSIIYATALEHDATIWTQDEHFKDLKNVKYFPFKQ